MLYTLLLFQRKRNTHVCKQKKELRAQSVAQKKKQKTENRKKEAYIRNVYKIQSKSRPHTPDSAMGWDSLGETWISIRSAEPPWRRSGKQANIN
jgi:hypothetical protein